MSVRIVALLVTVPVAMSAQASAGIHPTTASRPAYRASRADEDWGTLRDSSNRTGRLDGAKVHALGGHAYLSLGADVRLIEERYRSEDFGRTSLGLDHSLIQRYMVHADLRTVADSARFTARLFAQLKSGLVGGRSVGARVPDTDTLDIQQAFAELSRASPSDRSVSLRVGRQELVYGSQRLIGLRDFPNVRQTFDLARVMLHAGGTKPWQVDVFGGRPVTTRTGVFDDATDRSKSLWGAYATRSLRSTLGGAMDLYYVGHHRDRAATHLVAGRETRHTLGARVFVRRSAGAGVMDVELEPMLQFGHLADDAIRAWSASGVTGWRWSSMPAKPRLSLGFDASSGDRGPSAATRGTYHPLYATGGHMALGSPLGAVNFMSLHPKLEATLTSKALLFGDWFISWRESTRDGVYNIAGIPIGVPGNRSERFIGHRPGIHLDYVLSTQTSLGACVTRFMPGPYLRASGWKKDTEYATVTATYRF
ncbi:alginate export family protein [Gemmatimonas groenlandica]|uniref:Alginate export family protein n=1 Tax=Gemmatimonas groenlandica TaxID=2732249 RepID=A0A6M4IP91_9BACT|nr:alginate export family protein [Gemmatimonas groenlandica]QJR34071.1 alginate export family protein [Gemmatimonas groenlandica]